MKKIFAALATSAVAVSMLAFAGCGEPSPEKGAIPGNYEEKTPEQVTEIVDKIDTDKIFGGSEDSSSTEAINMGVKVNLEGGFSMGEMMSANGTVVLDYKMTASETAAAGSGSMSVKGNFMSMMSGTKVEQSIDFSGNAYNDTEWVYAASGEDKVKINMEKLVSLIEGSGSDSDDTVSPASFYAAEDVTSISSMLAMAQQYGVKVAIDDKDGVKIKLSVTEETIWTAVTEMAKSEGMEAGQITATINAVKGFITFNTFKFDAYFAIDEEGKFSGASVVMDIDVKVNPEIMDLLPGEGPDITPTAAAEETAETSYITITLKGSAEVYTHGDTVTVPDTVKNGDYLDMTDTIIAMIGNMM